MQISERRISLKDILRLIKFWKENSIDIIHAHGKGAGLIARIIKIFLHKPLIYTFHGIHTNCLSRLDRYLYIFYMKILQAGLMMKKFLYLKVKENKVNTLRYLLAKIVA